jgi:hypothetical protein
MKEKNKYIVIVFIMALLVAFFVSLVVFPILNASPKNIPIAIVSLDKGMDTPQGEINIGNSMKDGILEQSTSSVNDNGEALINWIVLDSQAEVDVGFNNSDFYAAIIIPEDFTQSNIAAESGNGEVSPLKIIIDQGQNPSMAATIGTLLAGMFTSNNTPANIEYIHPVGDNMGSGNAHIFTFLMAFITMFVCSIILFLAFKDIHALPKKEKFGKRSLQCLIGLLVSVIIGFFTAFLVHSFLNVNIPYMETSLYLSITVFCMMMLIVGVLDWTGIGGIAIFILMFFFGMIASNLPYEILPGFWQHWIYPWIPMRFMGAGLKEIFYLGSGILNTNTFILTVIGLCGIALTLLSALKPAKNNKL